MIHGTFAHDRRSKTIHAELGPAGSAATSAWACPLLVRLYENFALYVHALLVSDERSKVLSDDASDARGFAHNSSLCMPVGSQRQSPVGAQEERASKQVKVSTWAPVSTSS